MRMSKRLWYGTVSLLLVYLLLQARELLKSGISVHRTAQTLQTSETFQEPKCRPKTNIAFIKTHKTGSTTLMNIIQRFGHSRNLTFVLPRKGLVYLGPHRLTLNSWSILKPPKNRSFNILCNHVVYNKITFRKFMPKDTVYISILRHPLQRFLSAFWYYSHVHPQEYLVNIKGDNKIHTFLKDPAVYEAGVQYTNNAMATDLGLSPVNFHRKMEILSYIYGIDKDFSLVLILELFDESLVLLKRKLCWGLEDILYLPKNERTDLDIRRGNPRSNLSSEDVERHEKWDEADFQIYNHFYDKLLKKISNSGSDFVKEVKHFKQLRQTVSKYCQRETMGYTMLPLHVPESQFNKHFTVSASQCELLLMRSEEKFTEMLIHKQYPDLQERVSGS